jgi:predicted DNA-binding ribbon-helix-helix protein
MTHIMQQSKEESKTTLVSRNITVMGRRTSVRLEPEMWLALKEISARECCTIHDLCTLVSVRKNPHSSLTAAIRVFLMLYFRASSTEEGHTRSGHGNFEYMMQRARISEQVVPLLARKRGYDGLARAR